MTPMYDDPAAEARERQVIAEETAKVTTYLLALALIIGYLTGRARKKRS